MTSATFTPALSQPWPVRLQPTGHRPALQLLNAVPHHPLHHGGQVQASCSDDAWVDQLTTMALQHRAVQHPYLKALADGTLPDLRFALEDFACHYNGYSAHFPRYLTALIARLEDPAHRRALLENLTEESGE